MKFERKKLKKNFFSLIKYLGLSNNLEILFKKIREAICMFSRIVVIVRD